MTWGTVSAILFALLGLILVLQAYWLSAASLFPEWVTRAQQRYRQPGRVVLAGLLVGVPWTAGAVILINGSHPAVKLTGMLVLCGPLFLSFLGAAAVAWRLGEGLLGPAGHGQPGLVVFRGGLVLALLFLLPFIGWFVVLPVTLVTGFGAALLGLRTPRADRPAGEEFGAAGLSGEASHPEAAA